MYTRKQIEEIAQALEARGKKDSQFPLAVDITGDEELAILQNGQNMRTSISKIMELFGTEFYTPIITALDSLKTILENYLDNIQNALSSDIETTAQQTQEIISNIIAESQKTVIESVKAVESAVLSKLDDMSFDGFRDEIINALDNSTQSVLNDISTLYTQLKGDLVELDSSLSEVINNQGTEIKGWLDSLQKVMTDAVSALSSSLESFIETEMNTLQDIINSGFENARVDNASQTSSLQTIIESSENSIINSIETHVAELNAAIQESYNNILVRLNTVEANITEDIAALPEVIKSTEETLGKAIVDSQNQISDILRAFNKAMVEDIHLSNVEIIAKLDTFNAYWKAWESRTCVLIVTTQVPDALITINNTLVNTITVPVGYAVNIRVTAPGYKTFNEIVNIFRNQSINIVLEPLVSSDTCTLKVVSTPSDATVVMNSVTGADQTFTKGTEVNITVSREHYITQSFKVTVTEDMILEVALIGEDTTFTINPTPADSIVTINGLIRDSAVFPYGTYIEWEVSRTGYSSKTGSLTLVTDTVLPVILEKESYTVTLNSVPENAVIKINDVVQSSITGEYGTEFTYEVSSEGYVTASGTLTITKTETVTIVLEKTYVTIVEGQLVYTAAGGTKTANITSNTGWIFK